MFYLVGGAPRSGKTTIAKQLSKELHIPWISTDTLETVVSKYIDKDRFSELFPKTVVRRETGQSNDALYERYSPVEVKSLYLKQAETLWNALVTFVECEARCGHDYIIEGYHLPPELVSQQQDTYPLKSVFVGRESVAETLTAIKLGTGQDDWVINKTSKEETFPRIAEMLASFSTDVRVEAEKRGLLYIDMGTDLDAGVRKAVGHLLGHE